MPPETSFTVQEFPDILEFSAGCSTDMSDRLTESQSNPRQMMRWSKPFPQRPWSWWPAPGSRVEAVWSGGVGKPLKARCWILYLWYLWWLCVISQSVIGRAQSLKNTCHINFWARNRNGWQMSSHQEGFTRETSLRSSNSSRKLGHLTNPMNSDSCHMHIYIYIYTSVWTSMEMNHVWRYFWRRKCKHSLGMFRFNLGTLYKRPRARCSIKKKQSIYTYIHIYIYAIYIHAYICIYNIII